MNGYWLKFFVLLKAIYQNPFFFGFLIALQNQLPSWRKNLYFLCQFLVFETFIFINFFITKPNNISFLKTIFCHLTSYYFAQHHLKLTQPLNSFIFQKCWIYAHTFLQKILTLVLTVFRFMKYHISREPASGASEHSVKNERRSNCDYRCKMQTT